MNYFYLFLSSVVFLSGCVSTDSSSRSGGTQTNSSSVASSNSTSSSSSQSTTSSSNSNSSTTTSASSSSNITSVFDPSEAVEDTNACTTATGYHVATDNSLDPEGYTDRTNGITILSRYAMSTDPSLSEVKLFYPTFTATPSDSWGLILVSRAYSISYDQGWVANTPNVVYIKTPPINTELPECYKYTLNAADGSTISAVKVYR